MAIERVVIISDGSRPTGGAEALALLAAKLLSEAGLNVTFIAGDTGDESPLDRDNIELITLGGKFLLERPFSEAMFDGLHNTAGRELVARFIAERDTPGTVYHLHNWAQIFSPAVMAALRPVTRRLVMHAHDFALVCPNISYVDYVKEAACALTPLSVSCTLTNCDRRSYLHKAWRLARSWNRKRVIDLARTDALIAVIHPFMMDWFARGGVDRGRLRELRNPVRPFTPARIAAEANSDIFFIGRIEHEKGVDLAAEAARLAGRRLRVVGEGALRARLEQSHPHVVWEGWRSHDEIAGLMREARALVMPSRLPEPFGLVALEALQSGAPLIAFEDAFIGQEARDLGAAVLAAGRSPEALAEAMRVLDDDARAAEMSRIAFAEAGRLANTEASWRDAMIALYEEQLAAAGEAAAGVAST